MELKLAKFEEREIVPKVSVIIPVYNGGIYKHEGDLLTECMESVLNQTLHDIEIICAYRASDGDTAINTLLSYAENDKRVHIIYQQTKGMSAARNEGICAATGEYIGFLDTDDFYCDRDALERIYSACSKFGTSVGGGYFKKAIMRDNRLDHIEDDAFFHRLCDGKYEGQKFFYSDYQFDYKYYCYIYRRTMLLENEIFFPLDLTAGEDPIFHVKAMFAAKAFCVVPTYLYCWRVGDQIRAQGNYCDMEALNRHTRDDIKSRIENLRFSKEHRLHILHWINAQRLCSQNINDYLELYRYCDIETLRLFLEANDLLDADLIDQAQKHLPSEDILVPMELQDSYRILEKVSYDGGRRGYVLTPLLHIFHASIYYEDEMRETNRVGYRKDIELIHQSISYRIGRVITWIPRMIRGSTRCLRENGWTYTWRHMLGKIAARI